ncbi:MAG: hypothetical protein EOO70_04460, partial [Myxococcaceae bacterium]
MPPESLLKSALMECHRRNPGDSALSWYLAAEICDRFYCSHGIRPTIIEYPFGFYGFEISKIGCRVRKGKSTMLGRLSIAGNVARWNTGSEGAHQLELVERMKRGEPIEPMVGEVIRFLGLPPFPSRSHLGCRHQRWGESY